MGVVAVLVLGIASAAVAGAFGMRQMPGKMPRRPKEGVERPIAHPFIGKLELTDEQIAKIKEIQAAHFEATKALRIEHMEKMKNLQTLRWSKNPDKAAFEAARAEAAEIQKKLFAMQKEMQEKINAVLTQEQRDKLKEAAKRLCGKMGQCAPKFREKFPPKKGFTN